MGALRQRCGAVMLAIHLLLVTPVAHFPQTPAGGFSPAQFFDVLKNLSLLGACWLVWNVGCDHAREKREARAAEKAAGKAAAATKPHES